MSEAMPTLLLHHGPPVPDSALPLPDHRLTHILSCSLRHRSRISFKVKIRLARSVLTDDFVETAVRGDFQEISHKVCSTVEGAIPLGDPPFFPISTGPDVCSNVECTGGEVVCCLIHGLLGFKSIDPNLPEWEGLLPGWGARDLGTFGEGIETHGSGLPRCVFLIYRPEHNQSGLSFQHCF